MDEKTIKFIRSAARKACYKTDVDHEDVAQNVILRVLSLGRSDLCPAYVHAACRNAVVDARRKTWRFCGLMDVPTDGGIPEAEARCLVYSLREEDRRLAELAYMGYTVEEIASKTKKTVGAVKTRIHRLRRRARSRHPVF